MKRFITYSKMSKKQKRQVDLAKRNTFSDYGCLDLTSKVVSDKKKALRKSMCRKTSVYLCKGGVLLVIDNYSKRRV